MGVLKDSRKSVLLRVYIECNMDKDFFILSSQKDAFIIIDIQGQIVYANSKMEKLVDSTNSHLLAMSLSDLFVPFGLNDTQTFFNGKESETLNNFDIQIITCQKKRLDVNITTFPIFFEEEFLGNYIVLKDVTHLKRKRSIKLERDRHHRRLIEHSPEPIFILQNGVIINVNKKGISLLGAMDREELLGRKLLDVIHPDSIETFDREVRRVEQSEITDLFEQKMLRLDGELLNVEMMAFPIIINGEKACHVLVKDRSESMKLSLISQKQAVAGQLAAGVAHEIRNPITAIKGFLQLIKRENEGNKIYLEIIESEITRIEMILNELLVLAKPGKKKDELIDIRLILDQVVMLMQPQAAMNDIQIEKKYANLHSSIRGDENQLKQVFINYLKNSIDAMASGGKLMILGDSSKDNWIKIRIIDQGEGIPQEILEKVGEPFFTTKENGTGLGMLVSSQIINDHNGTVQIESDHTGTCVEVGLPTVQSSYLQG